MGPGRSHAKNWSKLASPKNLVLYLVVLIVLFGGVIIPTGSSSGHVAASQSYSQDWSVTNLGASNLVMDSNGDVYVVDSADNKIIKYDGDNGDILWTHSVFDVRNIVDQGGAPSKASIAINSDGVYYYWYNDGSGGEGVTMLSKSTGEAIDNVNHADIGTIANGNIGNMDGVNNHVILQTAKRSERAVEKFTTTNNRISGAVATQNGNERDRVAIDKYNNTYHSNEQNFYNRYFTNDVIGAIESPS